MGNLINKLLNVDLAGRILFSTTKIYILLFQSGFKDGQSAFI